MSTPSNPPSDTPPAGPTPTEPEGTSIPGPSSSADQPESPAATPEPAPVTLSLEKPAPAETPAPGTEPAPATLSLDKPAPAAETPAPQPEPSPAPTPEPAPATQPEPTLADAPSPAPAAAEAPSEAPAAQPTEHAAAHAALAPPNPFAAPSPTAPPAAAFGTPGGPGAPGGPGNPWGPPPGYPAPPYPGGPGFPPPADTNGLAVGALVLGILAVLTALLPFVFALALTVAPVAIGLGIAGVVKARRGSPRKGMAIAGIVLGALALPAAAGGVFFTVQIADELEERSDRYERNIDDAYDDGYDDLYGAPEPTASPTPSDLPGRTKPLAFGQTFRYDDGVEVTVKEAKGYKPEPNRYLPDRPKFAAKVTVTITNNSDKRIEVRLALPSARDDKGLEATRMYDAEVYKPFDGSLLPGQSATGVFGYGLPEDSKGLQFEIDPGPSEYEGAIWSGALS